MTLCYYILAVRRSISLIGATFLGGLGMISMTQSSYSPSSHTSSMLAGIQSKEY